MSFQRNLADSSMPVQPFYCVSHYEGEIDWVTRYSKNNHIIYSKGPTTPHSSNVLRVKNTGYNLSSYLDFIITNYHNLPEITIFCKNNIFERHIQEDKFKTLITRKVFTPLEDDRFWSKLRYPVSINLNDNGYIELNNNWYAEKYKFNYFSSYNDFYLYIFNVKETPTYLRFAPGANYLVPKENILLRTKNFYINLYNLISSQALSCESHYLERSLYSIWNSNIIESQEMNQIIESTTLDKLTELAKAKNPLKRRLKRFLHRKTIQFLHEFLY